MNMRFFGACAAVAALVAIPVFAQESEKKEDKKVEKIVILERVGGDHKAGKEGEGKSFRIHRLDGGPEIALRDCDGDKTEVNEGTGKERTHIILCGKDGVSAEDRVKRLEELRTKLAQNDKLSAEHRSRVEAALQKAIERLRAGN
ncbi:MAG TPA: hypothetical protein VNT77_06115 [Allosphingosinicella sp.]|nr:hypothetical protein [Allosphingosinicella sp.]